MTAPVAALAAQVGLDVVRDRARLVPELIRLLYTPPNTRVAAIDSPPSAPAPSDEITVDVPLGRQWWADAVFHRPVAADQLLAAILADRRAALVCRGLAGADDETLAYYAAHAPLLSTIYERAAPAFAAFGASVRIHQGRVVVPGGEGAQALWEAVLRARADAPDAFVRALLVEPEGRAGYLYDVLAMAAPDARAFALGLWIADPSVRQQRFQALALAVHGAFREWHVDEQPFVRPLNDLAILLLRVRVDPGGEPRPPAERQFWSGALGASVLEGASGSSGAAHTRIDAAWLVQATAGDMYTRGERLDQFAFGQRVFGGRPDGASETAAEVVRELPSRRMLLFGLEGLGITAPELYATALQLARNAQEGGGERFWTETQLQGALALLIRMHANGAITSRDAEALVRSLVAVPLTGGEFRGEMAAWIEGALAARLPGGETWQARVIAAAAGGPTPGNPEIEWEGQSYRVNLARAERRRITEIRRRQGGVDLDLALTLARLGRRAARAESSDALARVAAEVRALVVESGVQLLRPPTTLFAPAVPTPREGREWLARSADDLERASKSGDLRRGARVGESLLSLADITLGDAMVSLVYTVHLGDPDGPALLGANVALRHDFGFARREGDIRGRLPWALPRQDFQPGVPWHVVGSLVGLEIALAPLTLRRLSMDSLAAPPRLPSLERDAFATNVALLNARRLSDADRDRIVDAMARGRARVHGLRDDAEGLDAFEDEMALDGWRRRSLRWVLQNDPDSVENQFSLAELVALGGHDAMVDAWGASALQSLGCACQHFPDPRLWRVLAGRPQMPMMAAATVDMNLELAERLAAMRLPAALLPAVLATAMQNFVDTVAPTDPNDIWALVRYSRALSATAVADYIAASATLDGPLVPLDSADASEP